MPTVPRLSPSQPATAPVIANKNHFPPKPSFWKKFLKSCGLIIVSILIVAVFGITYIAVKTGFMKVPGISSLLYKNPIPNHQIESEDLNPQAIKNRVQTEVTKGKDPVEVYITEGNLTSIIKTSKREEMRLIDPQVALIDDNKLEIFGQLVGSNVFLTVVYDIGKDFDGNFKIGRLLDFKIGLIKVPFVFINSKFISEENIKNLSGTSIIEDALSDEGTGLKISNVKIQDGKIIEYVSLRGYDNLNNNPSKSSPVDLESNLN